MSEHPFKLSTGKLLHLPHLLLTGFHAAEDRSEDFLARNHSLVAPLGFAGLAGRLPFHLLLDLLVDQ